MALPLRVAVSPERADVGPGGAVAVEVTVRNTSDVVEHYVIDMLGLPDGSTARCEPEITKLRPGESGVAAVRVALARQPPAAAGTYVLGVLVQSRYHEGVSRCEELPLSVTPVEKLSVRVEPELVTGGRSAQYTVAVANEGNVPVRLRLTATDPERRVAAAFQPPTVDLLPGAGAQTRLSVRAAVPWSKEKHRALTVDAVGAGVAGQGAATFVQRPRFASRLTRLAGMAGAVLTLAGAVVAAAVIMRQQNPPPTTPVPAAGATTAAGATAGTAPAGPAGTPTASPQPLETTPTAGPATASPTLIDLAAVGVGVIPSDAFRDQGILLSGLPDPDGPRECAGATAVAVRSDPAGGRFLTAALPDNPAACNAVPVQIRFLTPAAAVTVAVGGSGTRRLEAFYRDLSRTVEDDLAAEDDGRRGGIDYVLIRGVPADLTPDPPPAAVRTVRFTTAG